MKTVVDEGVPVRLAPALSQLGRAVASFPKEWRGLQNGRLLEQIRLAGFECLLTCDKNLRHQQNLRRWNLAAIVLPRTRFEDLRPMLNQIAVAIDKAELGRALVLQSDGLIEFH